MLVSLIKLGILLLMSVCCWNSEETSFKFKFEDISEFDAFASQSTVANDSFSSTEFNEITKICFTLNTSCSIDLTLIFPTDSISLMNKSFVEYADK